MKVIYNSIIPFKGYICINLFGVLFVRKELQFRMDNVAYRHEAIHSEQMKELGWIPFYVIYFFEWLFRYFFTKDAMSHKAYRNISFEKEAYSNERKVDYLETRKHFSMWRRK